MLGLVGPMAMDTTIFGPTVRVVELLIRPEIAVIEAWPSPTLWARPVELMVATLVLSLDQVTEPVTSEVELSE